MIFKKIKNRLKEVLPISSIDHLKLFREIVLFFPSCIYDAYRYARFSATIGVDRRRKKLQAMLIKDFHIVEKGMSLPSPRPGYGRAVIIRTIDRIEQHIAKFGNDDITKGAINALKQYKEFNLHQGLDLGLLGAQISGLEQAFGDIAEKRGGVLWLRKGDINVSGNNKFSELARTRHSIRDFGEELVDTALLKRAAEIAAKTPSVCNRQSSKIYIFSGDDKKSLLALQNGNRGFGDRASHVAIIASDLQCFTGAGERNQPYIDGGLMAMSYVYALHSLGIGTCFLNWSVTSNVDRQLRKLVDIPASEVVITFLAIGSIPEQLAIAQSPRRAVQDFFFIK